MKLLDPDMKTNRDAPIGYPSRLNPPDLPENDSARQMCLSALALQPGDFFFLRGVAVGVKRTP